MAGTCSSSLGLSLPMVVDDMQDTVNQAYRAWPERLYVIDGQGRITYKSGIGPFGFHPTEAKAALQELLDKR